MQNAQCGGTAVQQEMLLPVADVERNDEALDPDALPVENQDLLRELGDHLAVPLDRLHLRERAPGDDAGALGQQRLAVIGQRSGRPVGGNVGRHRARRKRGERRATAATKAAARFASWASPFGKRGGDVETVRAPGGDQGGHYTHAERERRHRPLLGTKRAGARLERRRGRKPGADVRRDEVRQREAEPRARRRRAARSRRAARRRSFHATRPARA